MPSLQKFRSYEIAEDAAGASLELWRTESEVVCLASDPRLCQFVELHVVTSVDTTNASHRPTEQGFRALAEALMRVRHLNVIELREFGEDEGALFYVTELIDGEKLDTYLARCNPVPAWLAMEIVRQIAAGLATLRDEPRLLGAADIFNARLSIEGETTAQLRVRLGDFGLTRSLGVEPDRREVEKAMCHEVGRLLLYALSGLMSEKLAPKVLAGLPVPREVGQLLVRLLDPAERQSIRDIESLNRAIVTACQSMTISTRPERPPVTLRPRLPLHGHFPSLPQLGEKLSDRYRLERTPFDSLQPYAQRAFAGGQNVTVQLLPPTRLLSPGYWPGLEAASKAKPDTHPLLIPVVALPDSAEDGWFAEDAPPRFTLDGVVRLRRRLAPSEVLFLLQHLERAVSQAEKAGLSPVAVGLQQAFVDVESKDDGKAPTDEELAQRPVDSWAGFRLRIRGHVSPLQFTQPARFRRETLLDRPGRTLNDRRGGAKLEAPDYAATAVALFGGEKHVPKQAAGVIQQALVNGEGVPRGQFLEKLTEVLAPKPAKASPPAKPTVPAAPAATKPATTPEPVRPVEKAPPPARKAAARSGPKTAPTGKAGAKKAGPATGPVKPAKVSPPPAGLTRLPEPDPAESRESFDFSALTSGSHRGEPPDEAGGRGGFAQVLFGGSTAGEETPIDVPEGVNPDEPTVGGLFATGRSPLLLEEVEETDFPPMKFTPPPATGSSWSIGRLLAVMILSALAIAAIMATIFGVAPWSK